MIEFKNKKFNLFGTEWQIRFEDVVLDPNDKHEIYGCTYRGGINVITLARTVDGNKVSNKELKITMLHEIMHAIFTTGQYFSSNDDEPLVEWCARCLNQLIEKKII